MRDHIREEDYVNRSHRSPFPPLWLFYTEAVFTRPGPSAMPVLPVTIVARQIRVPFERSDGNHATLSKVN